MSTKYILTWFPTTTQSKKYALTITLTYLIVVVAGGAVVITAFPSFIIGALEQRFKVPGPFDGPSTSISTTGVFGDDIQNIFKNKNYARVRGHLMVN